jgi:hypothetical protein
MWFFSGLLSGLLMMTLALQSGLISLPRNLQNAVDRSERELLDEAAIADGQNSAKVTDDKPDYDFFRILPEQDIVIPESEVQRQANRQTADSSSDNDSYIL